LASHGFALLHHWAFVRVIRVKSASRRQAATPDPDHLPLITWAKPVLQSGKKLIL
jgi:hypothetical protein